MKVLCKKSNDIASTKTKTRKKINNNEAEHEEPTVTGDPIIKEPMYFENFECGKNLLNKLDATYEQACMITPRDRYSTELFRTITDCNDRNGATFTNENILYAIQSVILEEEADAHKINVHTFSQTTVTPNTEKEKKSTILTRDKQNILDALGKKLKGLRTNDDGYYE